MSGGTRRSEAPSAKPSQSSEDKLRALSGILHDEFLLPPLTKYNIYVEGHTDVGYLDCAARLALSSMREDLMAVPTGGPSDLLESRIQVLSPRNPRDEKQRGGVKALTRLGQELARWLPRLDVECFVMFVFDHDKAGLDALNKLKKSGMKSASQTISLHPAKHPGACGQKQIVVEDLLSLTIQKDFFESRSDCCVWITHTSGEVTRFAWNHPTKDQLCAYVQEHASWPDVLEIGRLLGRIRESWALPTSSHIFELAPDVAEPSP